MLRTAISGNRLVSTLLIGTKRLYNETKKLMLGFIQGGKIKSAPTLMHIKSANVPEWSVSTFKPSFWPTNINDKVRGKSARLHAARALS